MGIRKWENRKITTIFDFFLKKIKPENRKSKLELDKIENQTSTKSKEESNEGDSSRSI